MTKVWLTTVCMGRFRFDLDIQALDELSSASPSTTGDCRAPSPDTILARKDASWVQHSNNPCRSINPNDGFSYCTRSALRRTT